MAYTVDQFLTKSRSILTSGAPLADSLPQIVERLSRLLKNLAFVAESFNNAMPPGKRVLHHDPKTDLYVLAHVQEGGKVGKPHSHGASWAIYGNARAFTDMTEWRRTNPETEDHAELMMTRKYRLGPGRHARLWSRCLAFHRASREGLGDPRHRHRPRCSAALSLSAKDGQDFRKSVTPLLTFSSYQSRCNARSHLLVWRRFAPAI